MSKTMKITISALFTAVLAILAQIQIPIQPVPFSLTLFAVYLTGIVLPPLCAFGSVLAYLILGGFGVPIFAGMIGGPAVLFGPTGGYKIGYIFVALIVSVGIHIFCKNSDSKIRFAIFAVVSMLIGLTVCYLFGTIWFVITSDAKLSYAMKVCVYPFIPFDLLKILIAAIAGLAIKPVLKKTKLFE